MTNKKKSFRTDGQRTSQKCAYEWHWNVLSCSHSLSFSLSRFKFFILITFKLSHSISVILRKQPLLSLLHSTSTDVFFRSEPFLALLLDYLWKPIECLPSTFHFHSNTLSSHTEATLIFFILCLFAVVPFL